MSETKSTVRKYIVRVHEKEGPQVVASEWGVPFRELQAYVKSVKELSEFEQYRVIRALKRAKREPVARITNVNNLSRMPILCIKSQRDVAFQYCLEVYSLHNAVIEVVFEYMQQPRDMNTKAELEHVSTRLDIHDMVNLFRLFKL